MSSSVTRAGSLSGLRWFTVCMVCTYKLVEEETPSLSDVPLKLAGSQEHWVLSAGCCHAVRAIPSPSMPTNVVSTHLYFKKIGLFYESGTNSKVKVVFPLYLACHITCGLHALQGASFQLTEQRMVHVPNTAKIADAHSDGSQKYELRFNLNNH